MNSRVTKLAAAAVLVLAVLLLARHLAGGEKVVTPGLKKDTIAQSTPRKGLPAPTATVLPQEQQLAAQEQAAREYFAKADVQGLLRLLDTGQDRTKTVVADYLAQMGERSALPALEKLAAQWTGPAADNPFRKSIEQIQAGSSQPDKTGTKAPVKEDTPASLPDTAGSELAITVRVSDKATGEPIPQAPVRFWLGRAWQTEACDDNGAFVVNVGESVPNSVMIAARPEGYVWQSVEFRDRTKQSLPRTVQFSLETGTVIGGVVQDGAGRPVKGASVESYIQEPQKFDQPHLSVSIKETTDDQGRWRSTRVPAQVARFWFNVYHSEFADGGFEMPRDLNLDDLRAERAVMVLNEGVAVAGRVMDAAGNPIPGADLLAGEDYFARDRTKTDAAGRFEFRHLRPLNRSFLLTVQAKGFAPQRKELASEKGLAPVEFVLEPAKLLLGRVIDAAGHPVEGAFVVTERWNRYRTIKWQATTDQKGTFVWDYPPADAIQIRVSKQGYGDLTQDVVANSQEQVFLLTKPMTIQGSVVDGQTGKPVSRFKITPGIRGSPRGLATWQTTDGWVRWFTDGRYSYTFSSDGQAYAVRVEADGYVPVESRFVDANELQATVDIILTKGEGPSGYVFDANAQPVAGAEVFWTSRPMVQNGQAVNKQYLTRATTDRDGRFAFPADNRKDPFLALCDRGVGVVSWEEFGKTGIITLTPWARVQGDLRIGRQPGADQVLRLTDQTNMAQNGIPMMFAEVTTDVNGWFVFERVYPGEFTLYNQTYQIAPGQTLELHLGGTGRTVRGTLILPGSANTPIWANLYLTTLPANIPFDQFPKPPGYERMSLQEIETWLEHFSQSPEGKACAARLEKTYPQTTRSLRVEMDERHAFHVDNVEPGVYALRGVIYRSPMADSTLETIGRLWYEFETPLLTRESQLDVPVDLGALAVLPGELKPGDPAPDFDVPTFGPDRLRLKDYLGRVLLVGFYSRHGVGSNSVVMMDLKNAHRRFQENPRYAQIGLLCTACLPLDKKAVEEAGLVWPHGLVAGDGRESTEYSVPVNVTRSVLIGPRGEVLAVGLTGDALMQAVEQALRLATP